MDEEKDSADDWRTVQRIHLCLELWLALIALLTQLSGVLRALQQSGIL